MGPCMPSSPPPNESNFIKPDTPLLFSRMRRLFLVAAGVLAAAPSGVLRAQTLRTSPRLSLAEPQKFWTDPPATIAQRFALYRAAGVGTLRCSIRWDQMQGDGGRWHLPGHMAYLQQALQAGFALKLVLSTMGSVPNWFMQKNPDMLIRDQNGDTTHLSLSYWHPNLRHVLNDALTGMCMTLAGQGILKPSNFIVVDLGAAAEAKYPSAWNMNWPQSGALFWCSDANAASSFSAAMQASYGSIAAANAAWGTDFQSWSDVAPPKPGMEPGPLWNDMLTWYRSSKRNFTTAQLATYQTILKGYGVDSSRLVALMPGNHITPAEWQAATAGAQEPADIGSMIDTQFVIDTVAQAGCMMQYTGAQNAHEIAWIRQYMAQKNYTGTPLWGENAGMHEPTPANNPAALANVATAYDLYGIEYINAGYLFESDRLTPTSWFTVFRNAYLGLLASLPVAERQGQRIERLSADNDPAAWRRP